MAKKTLILNGCWAIVALLAFWSGSKRTASDATAAAEGAQRTKISRYSGGFGEVDAAARASRRDRGQPSTREGGMVAKLFGAGFAEGVGWQELADQAVNDTNPITRRLAFSRLLESMTEENALEIREQLAAAGLDGAEWRDFNYSWGAIAGKEAFDFASTSEERDMEAALSGWAAANPGEAMAMLDNLPDEMKGSRDELAESVVSGLADRDQALATDLALRFAAEGSKQAHDLIEIVARKALRSGGPETASVCADALPNGSAKGAAMDRIAKEFVRLDPAAAASWAGTYADQEYAVRVIEEVGDEWAERDPAAAVSWLETLPEGGGQTAGLNSAFGEWEDRDPAAAGQYLLTMAESPQRDSAISGFVEGYAWQDPQVAIAWAEDISDPSLRQQSLTQVGQAYFRRDPESAKDWLATSQLPAEVQQTILNPPRRRR